jgi:hypothetical protein
LEIKVRLVSKKGASSLVEWTDAKGYIHRAHVPSSELIKIDQEVFVENPEEGIQYGIDWESFIPQCDPEEIAQLLRKNGIWTYEDYLTNTPVVNSVFREAATLSLQRFQEAVRLQK